MAGAYNGFFDELRSSDYEGDDDLGVKEKKERMERMNKERKQVNAKVFDLAVLDEGHRIKNRNAQISNAIRQIPSRTRIVVTGMPMQNNLTEF